MWWRAHSDSMHQSASFSERSGRDIEVLRRSLERSSSLPTGERDNGSQPLGQSGRHNIMAAAAASAVKARHSGIKQRPHTPRPSEVPEEESPGSGASVSHRGAVLRARPPTPFKRREATPPNMLL
jgi:hypothetical protein